MVNELKKKYLLSEDGEIFTARYNNIAPASGIRFESDGSTEKRVRHNSLLSLIEAYNHVGVDKIKDTILYWPFLRGESVELISQGYLLRENGLELAEVFNLKYDDSISESRIRKRHKIINGKELYTLTLKNDGFLIKDQYESVIPRETYDSYIDNCKGFLEKLRMNHLLLEMPNCDKIYLDDSSINCWDEPESPTYLAEIDFYNGKKLVIAEVRCPNIKFAQDIPPLGKDITEDPKYENRNLSK